MAKMSEKECRELKDRVKELEAREADLKRVEDKFRMIYESSRDALMTLIPGGAFLGGNPATVEMFDCADESEFIAQGPADLSPEYQPDGRLSSEKAKSMMSMAMEGGSHFFEWTHKRINGEAFPATVLLTRLRVGDEDVLQATVRDITDSKQVESELRATAEKLANRNDMMMSMLEDVENSSKEARAEREKLSTVVENMSEGIILLGENGDVLLSNAAARVMLGKKRWSAMQRRSQVEQMVSTG